MLVGLKFSLIPNQIFTESLKSSKEMKYIKVFKCCISIIDDIKFVKSDCSMISQKLLFRYSYKIQLHVFKGDIWAHADLGFFIYIFNCCYLEKAPALLYAAILIKENKNKEREITR